MRIAITTVQLPFFMGGAEMHAQNLKSALVLAGHEAEIITLPFTDYPPSILEEEIIASRLLTLENMWCGEIDLCIGLKFPAYYIPHHNKVIWMLHQHRAAYDLFDTPYSNLKDDGQGQFIKKVITNADCKYLPEAKRIYANSQNVANRLLRFNGIKAEPLYHPCPDMDKFYCNRYEDYILMPSRINPTKRQTLALEAMSRTKSNIRLIIVGRAEGQASRDELIKLIKKYNLEHRVSFLDFVSQKDKLDLYANACGVLFIPVDEDYGYITLEAMAASKALITATDSGGPLEFIKDGVNGIVAKPTADDIADAMDKLALDTTRAVTLGKNAYDDIQSRHITWQHVVEELLK